MLKFFGSRLLTLNKIKFKTEYLPQRSTLTTTKMADQRTIFEKIIDGEIPSDKVYEDDKVISTPISYI